MGDVRVPAIQPPLSVREDMLREQEFGGVISSSGGRSGRVTLDGLREILMELDEISGCSGDDCDDEKDIVLSRGIERAKRMAEILVMKMAMSGQKVSGRDVVMLLDFYISLHGDIVRGKDGSGSEGNRSGRNLADLLSEIGDRRIDRPVAPKTDKTDKTDKSMNGDEDDD